MSTDPNPTLVALLPPAPFERYVRDRREGRNVAVVDEKNVGQIAALIRGHVDYTHTEPRLVVPAGATGGREWSIRMGEEVSARVDGPPGPERHVQIQRAGETLAAGSEWRHIKAPTPVAVTLDELAEAISMPEISSSVSYDAARRVFALLARPVIDAEVSR